MVVGDISGDGDVTGGCASTGEADPDCRWDGVNVLRCGHVHVHCVMWVDKHVEQLGVVRCRQQGRTLQRVR